MVSDVSDHEEKRCQHNSVISFITGQHASGLPHEMSKLDLCEGGSVSTATFNTDIQLSVYSFSCVMSVCPFVALINATYTYAENSHVILSILKGVPFYNLQCNNNCEMYPSDAKTLEI